MTKHRAIPSELDMTFLRFSWDWWILLAQLSQLSYLRLSFSELRLRDLQTLS